MIQNSSFFDDSFAVSEQLPREFTVSFKAVENGGVKAVQVFLNDNTQVGDMIDDNSHNSDYYRYHDIFHYTFAALLGWSPCSRALMKRKRKSNLQIDKVEDGARAAITEEAISLMIFNEAKKKNFFDSNVLVSKALLRLIKEMTDSYEVRIRTKKEWEYAIQTGYEVFRKLIINEGGKVHFNAISREVIYLK